MTSDERSATDHNHRGHARAIGVARTDSKKVSSPSVTGRVGRRPGELSRTKLIRKDENPAVAGFS
jgi:hypothetical protein